MKVGFRKEQSTQIDNKSLPCARLSSQQDISRNAHQPGRIREGQDITKLIDCVRHTADISSRLLS
jgi:hypothetical protein